MTEPLPADVQARADAEYLRLLARLPERPHLLPSLKARLRAIADRIDPEVSDD